MKETGRQRREDRKRQGAREGGEGRWKETGRQRRRKGKERYVRI